VCGYEWNLEVRKKNGGKRDEEKSIYSLFLECVCNMRAAQRIASVRIYSISTTLQGCEVDYEDIYAMASQASAQIAGPLVKMISLALGGRKRETNYKKGI
jgi:hypothetical protein